ncbi:hypothetical protein RvY_03194 [Ramazzottius varieornatus]|uniref:Uncharacterized protein n=1 Tax=Ramazzottius varieornatus TaxID=947166 RepID=A0A1D1UN25_RAMVA|nr:hypothetical protein RvY_03194 [Ramazzottius varieornatus]
MLITLLGSGKHTKKLMLKLAIHHPPSTQLVLHARRIDDCGRKAYAAQPAAPNPVGLTHSVGPLWLMELFTLSALTSFSWKEHVYSTRFCHGKSDLLLDRLILSDGSIFLISTSLKRILCGAQVLS